MANTGSELHTQNKLTFQKLNIHTGAMRFSRNVYTTNEYKSLNLKFDTNINPNASIHNVFTANESF